MEEVRGVVHHHAWGDPQFIPRLLKRDFGGAPCAELWLGTHPNGPSTLADGTPLEQRVGSPLPYLLKVLAAAQPLSLQTHPNRQQALAGFRRGDYPDDQPKPELLCALTPFEALCGVRPVDRTLELLDAIGERHLRECVASGGPGAAIEALYRGDLDPVPTIEACAHSDAPEARWVGRLDAMYPAEPSVAVALLLNLVVLRPGQALRLDAGDLHAYLTGAGIELMKASDNVIRGGLTAKPVDVDDLLDVVDPTPLENPVLPEGDRYDLPAAGVSLLHLRADDHHVSTGHELSIDMSGVARYCAPGESFRATTDTYVVVPLRD